jgi:glutamate/tyrosine decarboxylase-like PLP-dependent enzyme
VVDPHKHGLQPYGCGCVLFRDPAVGRFYRHDSPYTYFTSSELHLGEVSLECSRAGAAAAALWATLRLFPLTAAGLGAVLAACRRAATGFAAAVAQTGTLRLHQEPALDIVTYFPIAEGMSAADVDLASQRLFEAAAGDAEPIHLSVARVGADAFRLRHPDLGGADLGTVRVLRSVLMKPEHEAVAAALVRRLAALPR